VSSIAALQTRRSAECSAFPLEAVWCGSVAYIFLTRNTQRPTPTLNDSGD
jgi:hypothetical protein